jgi:hypothetical protein
MEPIGLRFKRDGELMIVHQCLSCGKISNNRIAGDDIPEVILMLIQQKPNKRNLLTIDYIHEIHDALYGRNDC